MNYPKFKKLGIEDKDGVESFTKLFPPYSDFSFLSLFTYNTSGTTEFAFYNDDLIVKFEDYLSGETFYSILGKNKVKETIALLLAMPGTEKKALSMVPYTTIAADKQVGKAFKVAEERDHFDYIIDAKDISELSPEKLPKKHRVVQNFRSKYPAVTAKRLDLKDEKTKQAIIELFHVWATKAKKTEDQTSTELTAIIRMLDQVADFPELYAIGLYDKDILVAFNSFDLVGNDYAISSFQKADRDYEGIYALLTHEAAKRIIELGCKYINFEQDLGFEGLRNSKTSWHPVKFLKKYTVSVKE